MILFVSQQVSQILSLKNGQFRVKVEPENHGEHERAETDSIPDSDELYVLKRRVYGERKSNPNKAQTNSILI
jgi:hypothetical protein